MCSSDLELPGCRRNAPVVRSGSGTFREHGPCEGGMEIDTQRARSGEQVGAALNMMQNVFTLRGRGGGGGGLEERIKRSAE